MEPDVLEQLYQKYHHGAYLYCLSLCGNAALAEDMAADAFVKAFLTLPDDVPSFRWWLLRVCRNLYIDHCRRQKHLASQDALEGLCDPVTPEELYLQSERNRALWAALATLSPRDRELVTLHYFAGLPLKDIAPLLGCGYAALRQRMTRLRFTLKQRMEEQGYGL